MEKGYIRVLAALDGGLTRRLVAERAASLAEKNGASLLFVYVIDTASLDCPIDLELLLNEETCRLQEELSSWLAAVGEDKKNLSYDIKVYLGRPVSVLVDCAIKKFEPDLVVCGNRGFSSLKYSFVGSVSTALIRNLECDVLVVRN